MCGQEPLSLPQVCKTQPLRDMQLQVRKAYLCHPSSRVLGPPGQERV